MTTGMQVVSSVFLEEKVYVIGVAKDKDADNFVTDNVSCQVQVFSLDKMKWSTLPMAPNYNAPIAVIDGHITLIGGRDAKTDDITDVVSTWFEKERQWKQILPRMPTKRLASGVCYYDNLLLVAGGVVASIEGGEEKVVNTVDVYNFNTKQWSTPKALQLLQTLRSPQVIVFKETIYIMGGSTMYPAPPEDGNPEAWRACWSNVTDAVKQPYASEQESSVWSPMKAPPTLRPTVVSSRNSLLSVGGASAEKNPKAQTGIYKFVDEKTDNYWIEVGNMKMGRCRHGVVPLGSHGTTLFVVSGYVWRARVRKREEINVSSSSVELIVL